MRKLKTGHAIESRRGAAVAQGSFFPSVFALALFASIICWR
jgi:hypothetical protein